MLLGEIGKEEKIASGKDRGAGGKGNLENLIHPFINEVLCVST